MDAKLDRLPPNICMAADTASVQVEMTSLKTSLNQVLERFGTVEHTLSVMSVNSTGVLCSDASSIVQSMPVNSHHTMNVQTQQAVSSDSVSTQLWSEMADNQLKSGLTGHQRQHGRFRGSMKSSTLSGLKSVPRQTVCFVERLEINTGEKQLCDFLQNAGIPNMVCHKLSAKDGRLFSTATFIVTCNPEYHDVWTV